MSFQYVLTTRSGEQLGRVEDPYERTYSYRVKGVPQSGVTLRFGDPLIDDVLDQGALTTGGIFRPGCDVLCKTYQGSTLRAVGELIGYEENSRATEDRPPSAKLSFAGPLWRLQKRLLGLTSPNQPLPFGATDDRDDIFALIVTDANAATATFGAGADTGIRLGTLASLYPVTVGPWYFKPDAEAFKELADLLVVPPAETPGTAVGQDPFTVGANIALGAHTAPTGGAWLSSGVSPTDFLVEAAVDAVWRGYSPWTADTSLTGGVHSKLNLNLTNMLVQVDCMTQGATGTLSDEHIIMAVEKYVDDSNWFQAYIGAMGATGVLHRVGVRKAVGGTVTRLNARDDYDLQADVSQVLRLVTLSDGRYFVWVGPTAGSLELKISGYDADLVTGEALATGDPGLYDHKTTSGAAIRTYDNFLAAVPVDAYALQGAEYELVPSEPTADSNQSGVVGAGLKIASLNVAAQIGTTRLDTIFEYGTNMENYKRAASRENLLTRGFSLPSDYPDNQDVRVRQDDAAITARGLWEDVISSDVADSQLRQALVENHVRYRKMARELVTFEPTSDGPRLGTDYEVGDVVIGRASVNGRTRFNGEFRVYGVDVTIDDEGNEKHIPSLVPDD